MKADPQAGQAEFLLYFRVKDALFWVPAFCDSLPRVNAQGQLCSVTDMNLYLHALKSVHA